MHFLIETVAGFIDCTGFEWHLAFGIDAANGSFDGCCLGKSTYQY